MFERSLPSIVLSDVGFRWPDGTPALSGITGTFGAHRTGLTGSNGSGKSTLLRLIAGELTPTSGSITTSAEVDHLPQTLPLDIDATVGDLLGIRDRITALRAIEVGDCAQEHLDIIGDDWDVESRATEALSSAGLEGVGLDRRVSQLSGGEATLAAVAGLILRAAPIVLMDEPTNNLDRPSRARLAEIIRGWKGALVVVSHDPALLDLMDDTAELFDGRLTVFGGSYSAWRQYLAEQQNAAMCAERAAAHVLRTERQQRVEVETTLARRARYAHKDFVNKRRPKTVMQQRKTEAQVSAGKLRNEFDGKVRAAQADLDAARSRVRDETPLRIDLPDPGVPAGRRIAEFRGRNRTIVLQGPEHMALVGPNGVGKTTLLELLVHGTSGGSPAVHSRAAGRSFTDHIGYLRQRFDLLDDATSVLDNVRAVAPDAPPQLVRAQLARFLLRGETVDRVGGTLSGGERFRVVLARLLLADPASQLIVLDEPTNNLDTISVDRLVQALAGYRGALLVVSHDDAFLERLRPTITVALDHGGNLHELNSPSPPA